MRVRLFIPAGFALALVARGALAERPPPPPPPPDATDAPPKSDAKNPNGEYTAPLSQTTQPTYVPQSVALSGPETIDDWDGTRPIPAGYHAETRKRKGLIISGASLLGASYLISAFAASIEADVNRGHSEAGALFVPVFGPFLQTANWSSSTGRFFLVVDGGCQIAGAALLLSGLFAEKTVLVRNDLGATLVPIRTRDGGNGLALVGRF